MNMKWIISVLIFCAIYFLQLVALRRKAWFIAGSLLITVVIFMVLNHFFFNLDENSFLIRVTAFFYLGAGGAAFIMAIRKEKRAKGLQKPQ